ncbi:hypothetical protein ACH4SK_37880 [Streptomyces inhibens]|uniref:hypothetical protein n=1 Tax=Streptomyces inhibens TaxID=2293571 RepID=UPI003794F09B
MPAGALRAFLTSVEFEADVAVAPLTAGHEGAPVRRTADRLSVVVFSHGAGAHRACNTIDGVGRPQPTEAAPHARNIIMGVDRAVTAVRPVSRALRIDVLGLRSAQAVVLHDYWRSHPAQLRRHRIWVPGIAPRSEWAEFYDQLATDFGLRIDAAGPNFGNEVLLDILADSADVATLVGSRDRYIRPTNHDLRRIPVVNPTLAYPLSLILPRANPHPGLRAIINHFGSLAPLPETAWLPSWATTPRRSDGNIEHARH